MTALGWWIGGIATLTCLLIAIGIRLRDADQFIRTTVLHAKGDHQHHAQILHFRARRTPPTDDYSTGWGDDAHLQ